MADKSKSITNGEGESAVSRVSKLPVVESTLNAASNIYSKVKDSNSMVTSVFNTAENAVFTAKEAVQPITTRLEGPYKKVDSMMCSGLDYVENKIPQIKLPPQELYENAKTTVKNTVQPAVKCVCQSVHKVADLTGLSKICAAGEQCINYVVAKKEETPAVNDSKCTINNKKFPQKPENPAKDD